MDEPPARYPTRAAIDSLAARFGLPNDPRMQDWEWEVADPGRIDEFLAAYESGELTDDERFTLMETMVQSFEELSRQVGTDPRWPRLLDILDRHADLHLRTIWYWSCLETEDLADCWQVTPFMRALLAQRR
jgi:hypothetical protein